MDVNGPREKSSAMPLSCTLIASALTAPILDGTVADPNLDLALETATVDENSRAMIAGRFDIAEMSMATYVQARARGLELIALPVFLGRRFLQPCVAFAPGAAIATPADLRGKRVALPQFWMTSSMWHRGLLEHEYGIPTTGVDWLTTQPERLDVGFSPGARVTRVDDRPLPALIADGTADAIFSPRPPPRDGSLAFLFPDPAATALEYRARTGVYPVLHTVVVREPLVRERPGLAAALFDLFARAKAHAYAHPDAMEIESPVAGLDFAAARERLGDPYPFGLAQNAVAVDAFLTYAHEQGLTAERLRAGDAFAAAASPAA
jgi:4,5-dihydroxyphthalate decarboxylase